ncbi:MAG: four helix bundle protein, partial [Flavobacterium sp.]
ELQYWLELCHKSEFYPNPSEELFKKLQSIHLIISKIIASSKKS